ncbi:MaoC family dehydratase N-terminal domain-containing protein [Nocardioides sp.]|uniref:FAS1-like dehydratase domain-containing protein n=1 Tax=Nocardioides sp. TaxID=35761 RepID=UPI002636A1D0|nr:MaoC family dehydratase N-terminal domain-containing protein [Nocardioides sp.]MDI6912489.1 MaoC family dehydratase N-terminal domain-containing protein [Nocardioides sp.]
MPQFADDSESYLFPVDFAAILLFARSVGDQSIEWPPGALTDSVLPRQVALPTFVASCVQFDPRWRYRPQPGGPWHGSASTAGGPPPHAGSGKRLHAEQHYEYHVPVRAGDVLTVSTEPGERWEKQARDGRVLRFEEEITSFINQRGELAVIARSVGVLTEVGG